LSTTTLPADNGLAQLHRRTRGVVPRSRYDGMAWQGAPPTALAAAPKRCEQVVASGPGSAQVLSTARLPGRAQCSDGSVSLRCAATVASILGRALAATEPATTAVTAARLDGATSARCTCTVWATDGGVLDAAHAAAPSAAPHIAAAAERLTSCASASAVASAVAATGLDGTASAPHACTCWATDDGIPDAAHAATASAVPPTAAAAERLPLQAGDGTPPTPSASLGIRPPHRRASASSGGSTITEVTGASAVRS
jgi:hypothetical protein